MCISKKMPTINESLPGVLLCIAIAIPAQILGTLFPVIGGPIIAILFGMLITLLVPKKDRFESGIRFTSKKLLQYAVILLGFGLNLSVVFKTGIQSFPIILGTISISLILAYILHKVLHISTAISTLIGVGSSICGGSAIAATATVIDATDEEVAQSISVIFFFNILAALIFPILGAWLGFSRTSGDAFGIFAGTAINDTSSVTAAASTWDSIYHLGSATLDKAVTVKLTRTLAIIPITLILAFIEAKKKQHNTGQKLNMKKIFPFFIFYFLAASLITTFSLYCGVPASFFNPFKELSKFLIILAMAAIGLNSNIIALIIKGGKPIFMGFVCWTGITSVSLLLQHILNIW